MPKSPQKNSKAPQRHPRVGSEARRHRGSSQDNRTPKRQLGDHGEKIAINYLTKKKYRLIEKNYSCRFGEIDLIMQDKTTVVFVEVKTRATKEWGTPEEAISRKKLKNVETTAEIFLTRNPRWRKHPVRIDVVAIQLTQGKLEAIRHHKGVYF